MPDIEAAFSLSVQNGDVFIYVQPGIRPNRGQYVFAIESCVEAGSGPTFSRTCIDSQPFVVTIEDPCFNTQIYNYGFPAQFLLEVPILQDRTFDIQTVIESTPGFQFPWPNSVNIDVDNSIYGNDVCGPIEYSISQVQPNLVTLNPDLTVYAEPIKDVHQISTYTLSLVGLLTDYNKYQQVEFLVKVTVCEAQFDMSALQLPLLYTVWYGDETFINLALFQGDIRQVPDCCHPLAYKAYWENPALPGELSPLPLEINFSNNVFFIRKCNPKGAFIQGDNECNDATEPFIK